MEQLTKTFFEQRTDIVAKNLLGKYLIYHHPQGDIVAMIVETEAYMGMSDPACHSAIGKTKRNAVMFGEAGHSYLYRIYGIHTCYNITTDAPEKAAAVLIRALFPLEGIALLEVNRPGIKKEQLLQGPGNLCKAMGWDMSFNGISICEKNSKIQVLDKGKIISDNEIIETTRVGITKAKDALLRFYIKGHPSVSKKISGRNLKCD